MIYLVRHGQTDSNISQKWQGQTGNDALNDTGKLQSEKLASYFQDKNINMIITSPLVRALETAKIISEKIKVHPEVDPLLIEMDYGDFAGLTTNNIMATYQDIYSKWREQPQNTLFPNGESFNDVQKRSKELLKKYFYTTNNILLVSHEDMIRSIIVAVSGKISEYWLPEIVNTSITTFDYSNEDILIKSIGETPHLL